MTYDYVIVGAGAAGCVLANRLSADPSVSVLLVETGGSSRSPLITVPRAFRLALRGERHVDRYPTRASSEVPAEAWIRGKGLGGSTAVNGMMYIRGSAADFDALEQAGNPGWGSSDFLAAYREMESRLLDVTIPTGGIDLARALFAGAENAGLKPVADFNDSDAERIGLTPMTVARGRRVSAATAFLNSVRHRSNLKVLTRTRAERLLFEGSRAIGVVLRNRGSLEEIRVRREVILCAGAIESPLLLERSGIGNADVLKEAGIDVRVEAPNVGERMIEHRAVSMQVRFRKPSGPKSWSLRALATSGYDIVSAFRSAPHVDRPDIHAVWVPKHSGLLFTGYLVRPTTASSVHVVSPSVAVPPAIEPHYLEQGAEAQATGSVLGHARSLLDASPLAAEIDHEIFPGPEVSTPAEVVSYARSTGGGIYHAVGSCAMGAEETDVVDAELRLRGVDGLRVVDASVLPQHLSGNPAAPVMALAWIAGARIGANF